MKTQVQLLYLVVFALVLASCGPRVTSSKMADVDLDNYKTFAWLPTADSAEKSKFNQQDVSSAIIEAVNDQMKEKGYTLNRENPDLLVLVHTMLDRETDLVANRRYGTYSYYTPGMSVSPLYEPYYYYGYNTVPTVSGYDIDAVSYTEGTLIVDLIDTKTNKVIWRGTAEGSVQPSDGTEEVKKYVDDIYEEFPS